MNDLIQRIVSAIIRQEGESPNARNPGNIRECPWFPMLGARRYYPTPGQATVTVEFVAYANGFWLPRSRAEGVAGAAHVVALHIAEGDSLSQLIGGKPGYGGWAPVSDGNKTAEYIANVKNWAGIPDEKLALWNYILDPAVEAVS